MLNKLFRYIREFVITPVSEDDRIKFYHGIDKLNLTRGKITAVTFMVMELMMLILSLILKRERIFDKPDIYYGIMYIVMIFVMPIFLMFFIKFERNISMHHGHITVIGVLFMTFILFWCGGISLLDQLSDGEIIIYVIAVVCVAVTPLYRPVNLLVSYFFIHVIFLILLPWFNISGEHLISNSINSTTIVIMSWVIASIRYKSRAEDYLNRKELREKSGELKRLNQKLEETNRKLTEANHKLEILSQTDSLTGVKNRFVFDSILMEQWSKCKKNEKVLSLIMIDIDFFKAYNDGYGHQAGDFCLKQVAEVLFACMERDCDTLARYGGEEFAILLPEMDKEAAQKLAEKMRHSVEQKRIPHAFSSVLGVVTISLGVYTVIPSDEISKEDFVRAADMALYEAKKGHRNKVVVA